MAERQGQLDQAEALYAKLVAKNPTLENAWFRLGYLQLQRGNNTGSIGAFEACLLKQADWPEAEINLSMAHSNAGDFDQADAVLRKLLARHPDSVEALKGLAAIALKRDDREKGLKYHRRLIDAGVATSEVLYNTGLLSQQLNNPEDAARFYRLALEARPDFAEAKLNLGHALESLGKKDEARACWVQALEVKPELARGYFRRSA
jgi:tetratricopeptide (TPR) repeat protein